MSDEIPIERTSFDLGRLAAAVDATTTALVKNREAFEQRLVASHRKMNWARGAAFLAGVAGVIGIFTGVRAQNAVDEMRRQRAEARITACKADNDTAEKINRLGDAFKQIITFATPPNPNRTPEQQMRLEQFVAQADGAVDDAKVDDRDCSPAGIEAYYSATTTIP
jgi:ABC-type branched-subunit amino acid transport system substrate-binding protein